MDLERGVNTKEIGHHYGREYECNCSAVARGIRTGATIMVLFLLGFLVILGISGHGIQISIFNDAAAFSGTSSFRPSMFTFNDRGAFGRGIDPLSFAALLEHERNSTVTHEESEILNAVFVQYDGDNDGLWSYADFTNFVEDAMDPDATFAFLDSKTNDGYIDYNELVTILTAFDSIPLYHTDEMNDLLVFVSDAVNESLEEIQAEEPVVIATLIYEVVGHGEDGISKEEWFGYLISNQWGQFNDDKDSFVDFAEFKRDFFESDLYLTFQECLHEEECANPQTVIQAFNDAEIVQNSRRRLVVNIGALMGHHAGPNPFTAGIGENDPAIAQGVGSGMSLFTDGMLPFVQNWASGAAQLPLLAMPLNPYVAVAEGVVGLVVALTSVATAHATNKGGSGCYDELSVVGVRRDADIAELISIRDVAVGDFVYDGNGFTKVYYLQKYPPFRSVKMLEIKYGVPSDGQSITLTPQHLLYREAASLPVRSDEINIGDVLWGITHHFNDDVSNFTVYDISTVIRTPMHPITMSSDMVVNGIKTSVFTHSVKFRDALHDIGSIVRWTSDHIDETLTQNVCNIVITSFQNLLTGDVLVSAVSSGIVIRAVYGGISLVLGIVWFKSANLSFADRSTTK